MQDSTKDPCSPEGLEYRFQELRAQRVRARTLFHCYAEEEADDEADELDDTDDVYYSYYAE
jgi:hypothetical protein